VSDPHELSRDRRSFLRDGALAGLGLGVLGVANSCGDASSGENRIVGPAPNPALASALSSKYILVDSNLQRNGTTVSLDSNFDASLSPGSFTTDLSFCGAVQFPSGRIFGGSAAHTPGENFCVKLGKDYANALALISKGNGNYQIEAGGDPQPLGAPWGIKLRERVAPGTAVTRLTGQAYDRGTGRLVYFTVSHDPAPIVVAGIVAGIVAVICGVIVLTEAIIDDCVHQAEVQCGHGNVKKITVNRTYGFSWSKGFKAGCGQECEIECK
jgi:hypothetical protein